MAPPTSSISASGPSSSTSSSSISITPAWLDSVDAVYRLFEDPQLSNRYASLAAKVKDGVRLCEEVVTELGLEQCALSFNGGKDCTVIVHMLAAVLRRLSGLSQPHDASSSEATSTRDPLVSLPSVYITCPSPFGILESFIRASQVRYNLDLVTVPGDMKDGLVEYFDGGGEAGVPPLESRREEGGQERRREVEGRQKRGVKAIFIGTRRTDPMGGESSKAARGKYAAQLLLTRACSVPRPPHSRHSHPAEMDRSIMAKGREDPPDPRLGLRRRLGISAVSGIGSCSCRYD